MPLGQLGTGFLADGAADLTKNSGGVFIHPLVHYARHAATSHFLLIWALFLVLIIVSGLLVSGYSDPILPTRSQPGTADRRTRLRWQISPTDGIAAFLFSLFLICYISVLFYREDFAYYDNDQLTDFSLQGKPFPPPIWPNVGRFFPLAFQEFNILRFITRSPIGYHSFAVVQLLILLCALFIILREFRIRYRVLVLAMAILAPSFVIAFSDLIYPERNVLFWLAIMLFCSQGYSRSKARTYFIGCLVATHFVLYYKETVVLLVIAYAATQLLLQLRDVRLAGFTTWRVFARENALSIGMLVVSGIYVAFFAAVLLPQKNFSYVAEHHAALSSVLLAYLQVDWLPLILLVVLSVRLWRFTFSNGQLDPLWDSLGVGAFAYCVGILALRLNSGYYLAPTDFIAILYLATMSAVWLSKPTKVRLSVVAIAIVCVLLQEVAYSSFRMTERKSLVTTKRELAEFLKSYLPTADNSTLELFFPYASGYHLMELSSYLTYRGFRLAGPDATTENGRSIVIEGREQFDGNRCVQYRDYACVHQESAPTGALIVVLPDDNVSMSDVEGIGKNSVLLLSLNPCTVCAGEGSALRLLHAISAEFSRRPLPEHWLQLQVFKKTLPLSISSFRHPTIAGTIAEDAPSLQVR
jgi:hypothetical protein